MSVLIKGMEMPKTEEESKLLILTPDGVTWLTQLGLGNQKFDTIGVPQHGRLIDMAINDAPTVIPADKDGET